MISELTFIRRYNTFWQLLFPGGDDYVRVINSVQKRAHKRDTDFGDQPQRRALVNGVAFDLFNIEKEHYGKNGTSLLASLKADDVHFIEIVKEQANSLNSLKYMPSLSSNITDYEFEIIKTLSRRLWLKYFLKPQYEFKPKLKGCGLIFATTADIYYKDTLVEIKAGQRTFSIQDLRQLYTYAALNYFEKKYSIINFELYNPRTEHFWTQNVDLISDNIAGMPTMEIFNEIIYFLTTEGRST